MLSIFSLSIAAVHRATSRCGSPRTNTCLCCARRSCRRDCMQACPALALASAVHAEALGTAVPALTLASVVPDSPVPNRKPKKAFFFGYASLVLAANSFLLYLAQRSDPTCALFLRSPCFPAPLPRRISTQRQLRSSKSTSPRSTGISKAAASRRCARCSEHLCLKAATTVR
jgi:hypothetical protein